MLNSCLNDNISKHHKFCFLTPKNGMKNMTKSFSQFALYFMSHCWHHVLCPYVLQILTNIRENQFHFHNLQSVYFCEQTLLPISWSVALHLYPVVVIQVLWLIANPMHFLFKDFSLQSVSFSHLSILPAPLPFTQLLLSYLLVTVLMSNFSFFSL